MNATLEVELSIWRAKQDIGTIDGKLIHWMSIPQRKALLEILSGEEAEGMAKILVELRERIEKMPKTYETDGQKGNAIVYLHYFINSQDAYITEKDSYDRQAQAFGLARLGVSEGELGYISIEDWIRHGAELDLHWTPKPLKDVK